MKLSLSRLIDICRDSGIAIRHAPQEPTRVGIASGTYEIVLGWQFFAQSDDEECQATVLAHELAHVARGDVLVMRQEIAAAEQEQRQPETGLMNVAMDAVINAQLPERAIKALNGVWWENLAERVPDLPHWRGGWRPIFNALKKRMDEIHNALADLLAKFAADVDANDSAGSDTSSHARTIIKLRDALRRAMEESGEADDIQRRLLDMANQSINCPGSAPWRVEPPAPIPHELATLLRALQSSRGSALPIRTRSFMRPGRVQGLRGVTRQSRGKICVAIDSSGSMFSWLPHVRSLAEGIKKFADVSIVEWATDWRKVGDTKLIGGGTRVDCLLSCADAVSADQTIILTDGLVFRDDAERVQHGMRRPVWVLCHNDRSALPKNALVIFHEAQGS